MFEKEIWIARRKQIKTNRNGIEIEEFEKPKKYRLNYQPISGNTKINEYGDEINDYYRIFVDRLLFQGQIKVGDRAYLCDGEISEKELKDIALSDNKHCEKANYKIMVVLPQNIKTRIDLMKIRSY